MSIDDPSQRRYRLSYIAKVLKTNCTRKTIYNNYDYYIYVGAIVDSLCQTDKKWSLNNNTTGKDSSRKLILCVDNKKILIDFVLISSVNQNQVNTMMINVYQNICSLDSCFDQYIIITNSKPFKELLKPENIKNIKTKIQIVCIDIQKENPFTDLDIFNNI